MITSKIQIILGDITQIRVDAVVNAANTGLSGGGGVDGAIHRAAGPELPEECKKIGGCRTGEAVVTGGYKLPARYIIHTVGPVWQGGKNQESEFLSSCYRNCLESAVRRGIRSIAFPAISTGAYGFPLSRAVAIAINEVTVFLSVHPEIDRVIFACHSQEVFDEYKYIIK